MTDPQRTTKDRLLDAAERVFARDGVQGARIRDINALAGQRNPSALHYHFGSRAAVVEAILLRYQTGVEGTTASTFDRLEAAGRELGVREIVDAVVRPLVGSLDSQSGRDCVRIIPQLLPALSRNLRAGIVVPATPVSRRVLTMLDERMASLSIPERVRRERLVTYAVVLTTLLGERAHHVEEGGDDLLLGREGFATHLVDVLEALLVAPTNVTNRRSRRS